MCYFSHFETCSSLSKVISVKNTTKLPLNMCFGEINRLSTDKTIQMGSRGWLFWALAEPGAATEEHFSSLLGRNSLSRLHLFWALSKHHYLGSIEV